MISTKARLQGGSLVTSIPTEVARRLGASPGDALYWVEDAAGHYVVTTVDPETLEALAQHEKVAGQYREVFRALAE
jgi:putative addiction module antidote